MQSAACMTESFSRSGQQWPFRRRRALEHIVDRQHESLGFAARRFMVRARLFKQDSALPTKDHFNPITELPLCGRIVENDMTEFCKCFGVVIRSEERRVGK